MNETNPESDLGFRPNHRAGSFLDKRDNRPTLADAVRSAASPRAILDWEARHGLTVASVSRYVAGILE